MPELKSLKKYLLAYRNLGIFYENEVNRILRDIGGRGSARFLYRDRRIHSARRF
jgi:NADPH-dependent 7-cyano-7-deazaguanine reductase QueF